MSDTEANKAIARRFLALVAAHDVDGLIDMIAPTWTMQGGPPNLPAGAEGIRLLFGTFGRIEQTWVIEHVIAEGDLVAVRAINTCDQARSWAFRATAARRCSPPRSFTVSPAA